MPPSIGSNLKNYMHLFVKKVWEHVEIRQSSVGIQPRVQHHSIALVMKDLTSDIALVREHLSMTPPSRSSSLVFITSIAAGPFIDF